MTLQQLLAALGDCDRVVLLLESPRTGCIHELELPRDAAVTQLERLSAANGARFYAPRIERHGDRTVAYVGPLVDPG